MIIYYDELVLKNNDSIPIMATEKGCCYIGGINETIEEAIKWISHYVDSSDYQKNIKILAPYIRKIQAYFENTISWQFNLPIDVLYGTEFQREVWKYLLTIPYGESRSYSDVAKAINRPNAIRAVGSAVGCNPISIVIPCHRVIAKNGCLGGFRGGIDMKKKLLAIENICYKR